jgi:DNA primase large subunit
MNEFNIEIASVPDREELVAEIWYREELIIEISQEKSTKFEINLYPIKDTMTVNYDIFIKIIELAKDKLKGEV